MITKSKYSILLFYITFLLLFFTFSCKNKNEKVSSGNLQFDGSKAFQNIEYQMELGPRIPGSKGHKDFLVWIIDSLSKQGMLTQIQEGELLGHQIKNVIAKAGSGNPWIILGTHYDTRIFADQDSANDNIRKPVPGANDGASGVAVLLEIARVLPKDFPGEIWLVFFDAEDNGNIETWDWILGSRVFVDQLEGKPDAMVLLDMIGDKDLNIYMERNSDPELMAQIWDTADVIGYNEYFIPSLKYGMLDDHIPFIQSGIPAVDIIDFDYPYWHTTKDTIDKVSADSLQIVGNTVLSWLETYSK
jgi:glutaminyl-peptide cyclotransferase